MKHLTMDDLKNPDNYKLHLVLPDPKSLSNGSDTDGNIREYYQECIRCIKSWRINGGWLKDIFIIIDYIGESLTQEQKDELISLNKVSIFSPEDNKKDNGFFDVHYSGKRIRDLNLDDVITIHIDLDMILLREIPVNFFSPLIEKDLIIGGYNIEDYSLQRTPLFGNRIFNTNLVITKSKEYSFFDFFSTSVASVPFFLMFHIIPRLQIKFIQIICSTIFKRLANAVNHISHCLFNFLYLFNISTTLKRQIAFLPSACIYNYIIVDIFLCNHHSTAFLSQP